MPCEKYDFNIKREIHAYEFCSEGPIGKINKIIFYDRKLIEEERRYSLSFGDWDENTGLLDVLTVSNNLDKQKILATLAASIIQFIEEHPNAVILIFGSTPSRTRLYQMGISSRLEEIGSLIEIHGFINGAWEIFRKGQNYSGFLIKRKS